MDAKLLVEILSLIMGAGAIVFAAGGFYLYIPKELARIREDLARVESTAEQKGQERKAQLDGKIDKNYETLDEKIEDNKQEVLSDLSGVGNKVTRVTEYMSKQFSSIEKDAGRRHNNLAIAMMLAAPVEKESQISGLLKEEAS